MAAAELSARTEEHPRTRPIRGGWVDGWLGAYCGVWASTLGGTLAVAIAGRPMRSLTRRVLGLGLHPASATMAPLGHILALVVHNIPIASWPVLLGLTGIDCRGLSGRVADCVVVMCVLANTVPVGAALATYGSALIPYVPQLPVEWAAIALGTCAWLVQRRRVITARERWLCFVAIATLLLCAGILETVAVPHRAALRRQRPAARLNVALEISYRPDSCSRQNGAVQVILHQDTHFASFAGAPETWQNAAHHMEINEHGRSRLATARIAQGS